MIETGISMERTNFLHTLDPRTKILLVLLFTVLVFLVNHPPAAPVLTAVFIGLWFAAGLPFKKIRSYTRLLSALVVFTALLQMLFGPGDRYILRPLIPETVPFIGGWGYLKWDGLVLGLLTGCRLASLMLLLPMLTLTTPPRMLALGLARLGLPYKAAYIATTALNLIPVFEEDALSIMDAQKLRGMRAFEGSLAEKFRAYPALAVPLVTLAMRRALMLGSAMDSRAFGAFKTRTWLTRIKMGVPDYAACAAGVVLAASLFILDRAL